MKNIERTYEYPDDQEDLEAKRAAKYEHEMELAERLNDRHRDDRAEKNNKQLDPPK